MSNDTAAALEELLQQTTFSQKFVTLQWVYKCLGIVSFVSCSWLIYDQLSKRKDQNKNMGTRIVLFMSVCDAISSFTLFILGSTMVPKGYAWGALGNEATCTAQGFIFTTFSNASSTYNAMLGIYYLLTVRHNWKPVRFQTICNRFWFLAFPLLWTIPLNVWGVVDKTFNMELNPVQIGCHYWFSPISSIELAELPGPDVVTNEKTFFVLYYTGGMALPIFVILLSIVFMFLLWAFIRTTERKSARWAREGENSKQKSMQAAKIGILFCGSFVLAYTWYIVCLISFFLTGGFFPDWMLILATIFLSLQGFFNTAVYAYRQSLRRGRSTTTANKSTNGRTTTSTNAGTSNSTNANFFAENIEN